MFKTLGFSLGRTATMTIVKVAIAGVATVGGTSLVSSSVFASLTASATNTSGGSVTTGTLKLTETANGAGFATAITAMGPGDTVNRYIDLTNSGTLDGTTPTLSITNTGGNALTTDGTNGIKVVVTSCAGGWVAAAGTCTGGTTTSVLSSTSAPSLASPVALTLPSNLAGAVSHLQFAISLPVGTENVINGALPLGTVQGLTTVITWSINETMRNGTTLNS
jgi:hypothetical protein